MSQVKKIIFVAMPSVHFIRWVKNIPNGMYEMYWFDILERGYIEELDNVNQITDWKKRKLPYIKGEHFLAKNKPKVFRFIEPILQITANEKMTQLIKEIQPDVIHSFEMHLCTFPILKALNRYNHLPWLYSCWGSDIYFYENLKAYKSIIKNVLKRVNYLQTDCKRDVLLAKKYGFSGVHFEVVPGGGGYLLDSYRKLSIPVFERKIILLKGYEHIFGRALNVVKALEIIKDQIKNYQVVVFGTHTNVIEYIKNRKLPFKSYGRHEVKHQEVLKLMGESKIYIGNNVSDGMPNTLLEAIIMGAFPIQSNPGGATAEIIEDGKNGFLIEKPEDPIEISILISRAIESEELIEEAYRINKERAKELEYFKVQEKILKAYEVMLSTK